MPNKMYLIPAEDVELLRKVSQNMHKQLRYSQRPDEVDYRVDAIAHGIDLALKELGLDRG